MSTGFFHYSRLSVASPPSTLTPPEVREAHEARAAAAAAVVPQSPLSTSPPPRPPSPSPQATPEPIDINNWRHEIPMSEAPNTRAVAIIEYIQYKCRLAIQFLGIFPNKEVVEQQQQQQQETLFKKLCITIYMAIELMLFAVIFIPKEIAFSLYAYIDMLIFSAVINFILFHLKNFGACRDCHYIDPHRMFKVGAMETKAERTRVAIRLLAIWFAVELLKNHMEVSTSEAIHNIISPLQLMWKKPKTIEWEAGMEKTTFTDSTVSTIQIPSPPLLSKELEYHEMSPCSQMLHHCIASKFPSWLSISSISPNAILCNVCKHFLPRCECHQDKNDLDEFALATQGARILVDLTSPTFEGNNKGILSLFKRQQRFPSPLTAILPWEEPGECWPMAAKHGSLGVELSKPVSVKAVSIDHLDHPVISNTSAPTDFDVWGLTQYDDHPSSKYPWDSFPSMTDRSILYLGRFTYDIRKGHAMQTFEINVGSIPPINAVVFRFHSNWGQNDYTCIYRVRVHGEAVV